jgi:small-conductance mechanosensitive channel
LALFLKYVLLIDISSLLTLAGIISIAVGYASQQIIQDFINGILLLLEESITLNDDIEVNGVRGIVEDINLHCIYVRDKDNNLTVIPCSKIINGYTNYTQDAAENRTRILEATKDDYDYKNSDIKEGK